MNKLNMKTLLALSGLCAAASSVSFAADLPNIGDALRQAQPPKELQRPKEEIPAIGGPDAGTPAAASPDGKKVAVKQIIVTGADHLGADVWKAIVSPYENKELSFKEMEQVAGLVTQAYRAKGYTVARAYIPKQDLHAQEAQLKIDVVEGRYGSFDIQNTSRVSSKRVSDIFEDIKRGEIVSDEGLERALLIANDTPGLKVSKFNAKAGGSAGTSDFDVGAEPADAYDGSLVADNYGSKYTGRYKVNAGLNINSPFGIGDKAGFNLMLSNTVDLRNGRVYYNAPLSGNGLRAEVAASRTTYSLAGEYKVLDALGSSNSLEASLSYPVIKTKKQTLDVRLAYAHKQMTDEVRSVSSVTHKGADTGSLGLSYVSSGTWAGWNTTNSASLTLTRGHVSFKDEAGYLIDQEGAKTQGAYSKVGGSWELATEFSKTLTLTTWLRFQRALGHKNLDGSEDFALGGASGVRAFPDGEHSAENGYLAGLELAHKLPKYKGISQQVSVFSDVGYASMARPIVSPSGKRLSDVGLGYQVSYQTLFAKLQFAQVVGSTKSEVEDKKSALYLLQVGMSY